MKLIYSWILLFSLSVSAAYAQLAWFPFTLPWDDNSKTGIDAADLLIDYPGQDPATVIDARGFLQTSGDGHFYFEKTGKRARFWGVNFTFNANFPPCPDEPLRSREYPDDRVSDKVARHLAKLGVNVVRFHHMDTSVSPDGIWDPRYYPNDTQHLESGQMKRLDYLIYQLRKNGIYVNLNLKVGRHFGLGDGVPDANLFNSGPTYFQGVSHFNQRMIDLQRDYAQQLLAHRNPYTGKTYAEDPCIAFVEIANEDSLFGNLYLDELNYLPDTTGSLPERYSVELDARWNEWLAARYASRAALEAAWKSLEDVGDTSNKIRNGNFENGMSGWSVNPIGSARVSARVESGVGPDGSAALRVEVTSDGTNWHVQCTQSGHALEKDKSYEFSFYAKASSSGEITIDIMKGIDPWSNYGLSKAFQLGTTWKRYNAYFTANTTDPTYARPTFELGARDNIIWIDQVEFRRSAPKGLETGESFENGTVRRPARSDLGSYAPARTYDLFRFYSDIDEKYFLGMFRYLKDELGVKAMITGTAPWWAYLGDVAIQSKMDYVDGHYYWDHPSWPAGQAWSATGWTITNRPWINQFMEFSSLVSQAVEGKPFTFSEFNQPFPNSYALEGPLLVALTANLQDWDGVYMFDYAGSATAFTVAANSSFFSLAGNPVKSGQLPICARAFLGRQSAAASSTVAVDLNRDELAAGFAKGLVSASQFLESKGLDRRAFLRDRLRIRTFDRAEPGAINYTLPSGSVTASNGEIAWMRDNTQGSYMVVKGAALQGAVGFLKQVGMEYGDWAFQVAGDSPDHLAVMLQSWDGTNLRESRRMILSIWTEHQNTGMIWNDAHTSVDNRWGGPPTTLRAVQLDLTLRFPAARSLRLFPLDEKGNRKTAISADRSGDSYRFQIDTGRDLSVWYEVELNDAAATADFTVPGSGLYQLYTTGTAADNLQVGWLEIENRSGAGIRSAALLEYSSRGILTSVARLPDSNPVTAAYAPVIRDNLVDTAVAVLNRQPSDNNVTMRLLDSSGVPRGLSKLFLLKPGEERAFFVREVFDVGAEFEGTLEFRADSPFLVLTLRSIVNGAGDFSLTPYPQESTSKGPLYFAHLAADSSYSTDILLWNSQALPVTARLEFYAADGEAAAAPGQPLSQEIRLIPGQMRRISLARSATGFFGYARLTLVSSTALPSSIAVITRWENGAPVSEAGIPATPELKEEILPLAEKPNQRTALALLNPALSPANVELELLTAEGTLPKQSRIQLSLAPGEKRAFFLYEAFSDLPTYLTCLLRVRSNVGIATLALLGVTNERNHFLMAALTGEPERVPLGVRTLATVPRYATGTGYRTILYLLPAQVGSTTSQGQIRFFDTQGKAQPLLFR